MVLTASAQQAMMLASQLLLEKRPADARPFLEKVAAAELTDNDFNQRVAGALVELGEMDEARQLLESALDNDPENALVHAQLAGIHFRARRFDQAIGAAVESLSLLYFQPGLHALLGQSLMETKRFDEAERELLVAVSQSPRHIAAHDLLAKLYRERLNRPADAFAHEGRARSLRHEVTVGRAAALRSPSSEVLLAKDDGERGSPRADALDRAPAILSPSPRGEGRGEGEQFAQSRSRAQKLRCAPPIGPVGRCSVSGNSARSLQLSGKGLGQIREIEPVWADSFLLHRDPFSVS